LQRKAAAKTRFRVILHKIQKLLSPEVPSVWSSQGWLLASRIPVCCCGR